MNAAAQLRRVHAAAQAVSKPLQYRAISGDVIRQLEAGTLVRTGDILDRLGAGDLRDGYQSHYGKHVAKAYRAANEQEPTRCWVQHRTTGRWIRAFVYSPFDLALYVGLVTYKRTAFLASPAHFQAAYTAAA
ncbi:hypothetical protein [Streptomyces sp. 351MFTsu5.1]|uniref:hypothetical protein n=1 Tax=Streptomyces sp. 351MFTsu5.1 TaxID=1172180 RepID=UPI000378E631|nr:hypothetical protein [Streptomyces sp. 351MFTsu5.1]